MKQLIFLFIFGVAISLSGCEDEGTDKANASDCAPLPADSTPVSAPDGSTPTD